MKELVMKTCSFALFVILALITGCSSPACDPGLGSAYVAISQPVQLTEGLDKISSDPVKVEIPYKSAKIPSGIGEDELNVSIFHKTGDRTIRMGHTELDTDRKIATVETFAPGEYYVAARKRPYRVRQDGKYTDERRPLLLVHGPLSSFRTWKQLKAELKKNHPGRPIFTFDYPVNGDMIESGVLLADEMKRLHDELGDFELDVITHSYGILPVMAYIGDKDIFQDDINRLLSISPPMSGSLLASKKNVIQLAQWAEKTDIAPSIIEQSFTFYNTLGGHTDLFEPSSAEMEELYINFFQNSRVGQYGGSAQKAIEFEVIRGNKPFFDLADDDAQELSAMFELKDGTGDGLMDSEIDRSSQDRSRISVLSMLPLPYNHLDIIDQPEVCRKAVEFLSLPEWFSTSVIDNPEWEDYYREAEYEIEVHKWRDMDTATLYDYNRNMLATVEQDGILFTNGDNDTYYSWSLQDREGYRRDVTVVNLSLLNTAAFIKLLRKNVPMRARLTDEYIDETLCEGGFNSLMKRSWETSRTLSIDGPDKGSPKMTWSVPAPLSIPIAGGETAHFLRVQDYMILDILHANRWKLPIYFAVTCSDANLLGLRNIRNQNRNYLAMEGLAFRLTPEPTALITPEKMADNLLKSYDYHNLNNPETNLDRNTIKLLGNYRQAMIQLSYLHLTDAENTGEQDETGLNLPLEERVNRFAELPPRAKALTTLDFMQDRIPEEVVPIQHEIIKNQINQMYSQLGRAESESDLQ